MGDTVQDALKYTIAHSPVEEKKLSKDGQKLIADVREIIETARQMVLQKNSQEEFQKFLHASTKADVSDRVGVKAPVDPKDAKKDAETAGEALQTLIKLFLRNGELRKLFQDVAVVGRDVFADATSKASDLARPDEEALAKVDHPAPDNEFHEDIPNALKPKRDVAAKAQNEVEKAVDTNADAKTNANNLLAAAKNVIPDKHKEVLNEHTEKTKNYLKEKFPKERQDQFVYRLKKIVVECQRHREYQDAMEFFLTAFELYKGHAAHIHGQVENAAVNARGEGNVQTAESTFRTLIERFANGRSTQPMLDALDMIYTDIKNDPELKEWFGKLDKFLRNCVQVPGYIMKDEVNTQSRQLVEAGKKFFVVQDGKVSGKYAAHKDKLFDEVETFFTGMAEDPLNKKFGDDWKRLVQDIFLDSNGNATFKPHLWSDIRDPILPELAKHIGYVPIPRIEYSDKQVDLVIENLTVEMQNLLPNVVEIHNNNYVKFSAYKQIKDVNRHSLRIALSQIQSDMRDIHFSIVKKTGFPKIKDSGTADVFVGGKGLEVDVEIEFENIQGRKRQHVFTVKRVKANVAKLDFAIRHSSKDLLIKILKPLASGLIKKQIAKAIEAAIREGLEKADSELVSLLNSLDAAKSEGKQLDVLKEKLSKAEDKKNETSEKSGTFKLATSKRNSILPNMGDKNGWINRIDERSDAARNSVAGKDDWHSPAFSIVAPGQKEPTNVGNLPTPASFDQKPNGKVSQSITGSIPAVNGNVTTATGVHS